VLQKITDGLTLVVRPLGHYFTYIGAALLAIMMLLTAADVIARYFAGQPIKGGYELQEYLMAMVISFAMALCALKKGHINVDVFMMRMPRRVQAVLNAVIYLICLGFTGLIVWQSFKYALLLREAGNVGASLPIPIYPFVIALTVGIAIFALVLLRDFFDFLRQAVGPGDDVTPNVDGDPATDRGEDQKASVNDVTD